MFKVGDFVTLTPSIVEQFRSSDKFSVTDIFIITGLEVPHSDKRPAFNLVDALTLMPVTYFRTTEPMEFFSEELKHV